MGNLTVKQKLFGLIAAILISFGALSAYQLTRLSSSNEQLEKIYSINFTNSNTVSELDSLLTRVDINILRMIAIGDPQSIRAWKEENNERFAKADKLIEKLAGNTSEDQKEFVSNLRDSYAKMRAGMQKQVQLIEAGDIKGGGEVNRTEVKDNANATFASLVKLDLSATEKANTRYQDGAKAMTTAFSITLVVLTMLSILSILTAFIIINGLIKQLGGEPAEAERVAREIAGGNLAVNIETKLGDTSSLFVSLKAMQESLVQLIGGVRSGADGVSTASREIASGNNDLSARTEQQASALEETAASMEELSSTVKQNADSARQANTLSLTASTVAVKGGDVVGQVVETMKGINESSKKISDIISVIDSIAFQTNILALNAAVEAARAGEQGRGFAVVASEVRLLAGRSAEAAKEIKNLINDSVQRVEHGTVLVDQAGITMTEVVNSIKLVTDLMSEITLASNEQSQGVVEVGAAVIQMDKVTQENAALVEEMAAAATILKTQAHDLVSMVAVFKLPGNESRGSSSFRQPSNARNRSTQSLRLSHPDD